MLPACAHRQIHREDFDIAVVNQYNYDIRLNYVRMSYIDRTARLHLSWLHDERASGIARHSLPRAIAVTLDTPLQQSFGCHWAEPVELQSIEANTRRRVMDCDYDLFSVEEFQSFADTLNVNMHVIPNIITSMYSITDSEMW